MAKNRVLQPFLSISKDKFTVDTIEDLKLRKDFNIGDVVGLNGYYTAGDGAGHKRIISQADDGSGVQLSNGLWANIVHNGEVNVSWFGGEFLDIDRFIKNNSTFGGVIKLDAQIEATGTLLNKSINFVGISSNAIDSFYTCKSAINYNGSSKLFKMLSRRENVFFENLNLNSRNIGSGTGISYENEGDISVLQSLNKNSKLKNIVVTGFDTGLVFGNLVGNPGSQTDGHRIIGCTFYKNNVGIRINSNNFDYSTIENCNLSCYDKGIHISKSGFFKISQTVGSCPTQPYNPESTLLFFDGEGSNGTIKIEGIQAENIAYTAIFNNNEQNTVAPITFTNCRLDAPIWFKGSKGFFNVKIENTDFSPAINSNTLLIDSADTHVLVEDCTGITLENVAVNSPYSSVKVFQGGELRFLITQKLKLDFTAISSYKENSVFEEVFSITNPFHYFVNVLVDIQWYAKKKGEVKIATGAGLYYKTLSITETSLSTEVNSILKSFTLAPNSTLTIYTNGIDGSGVYTNIKIRNIHRSPNPSETLKKVEVFSYNGVFGRSEISAKDNYEFKKLNTPYHAEKMKQEGVYDDFITYMDEKTAYNNQQREKEKAMQLAYAEALKENPDLTYEEFVSTRPTTFRHKRSIEIQEPVPSQALLEFKERYLG